MKQLLRCPENWRYVHPDNANVVIVISRESPGRYYQAIIAQDRREGTRIFLRSICLDTLELALRNLLDWTSDMVSMASIDAPSEVLTVHSL